MDGQPPDRTIDVVIPAYNEAASIEATVDALFAFFDVSRYRLRVVVVDDGSTDRTAAIVKSLTERLPVTLITLTRNFGKETALLAGLDHARGDATILMDADLQHPIELLERFIEHWENGYQCVYGVKEHRRDESVWKRAATKLFYRWLNAGSELTIPEDAGDFRLLDRKVVTALCSVRERVRFTKGLYAWLGFRCIGVPYVPAARAAGTTRFDAGRLLRLGWDGLTSFSDLPLRMFGVVGAIVAIASLFYAGWIWIRTLVFGVDVPGWATLTVAVMFLSGIQILFLGVLGQYVRNVFIETKQRPSYLVEDLVEPAAERQAEEPDTQRAADGSRGAKARAGRAVA